MRKICALFLAVLLTLGCIVPAFAEEPYSDIDCAEQCGLLSALGIFTQEELTADFLCDNVTRGDYAKRLAVLLNVNNYESQQMYFYDTKDIPEADALASMGIFKAAPDGLFCPDRNISKNEVAITLVRALGYEQQVVAKGNNISAYLQVANRLKLLNGFNNDDTVTVAEVVAGFYNLLLANTYEIEYVSSNGIKYSSKGDSLLKIIYDCEYVEGVVTETRFTGLYGDSEINYDCVSINNKTYKTTMDNSGDYIGQNVYALIKNSNDIETVVHMASNENKNDTITLLPGEFTYNNHIIEYEVNNKTKKVKLSNSMAVIKNNQAVSGDYDKAFDIKIGSLKLYKNEYAGSGYSVAVIDSAETAVIQNVDFEYEAIYTNNDKFKKIDYVEDGKNYIKMYVTLSGQAIDGMQLKKGDLVEVYRSENGKYTKLYLCAGYETGVVSAISKDGNKTLVQLGDNEYDVSYAYVGPEDITAGLDATFVFDSQGKIAYFYKEDKPKRFLYGYVYKAAKKVNALDNEYKIKVFDENGVHNIYQLANKVKLNGDNVTSEVAYNSFIDKKTGEFVRKMTIFTVNKDGDINYIDTPASSKDTRESEGTLWEVSMVSSYKYEPNGFYFAPLYPMSLNRTKVFIIPPTNVEDPKDESFAVMPYTKNAPFVISYFHNVGFYKHTSDDPFMDVVVYVMDEIPAYSIYQNALFVDDIRKVYDEYSGEECVSINAYISYNKYNMDFADEVVFVKTDKSSVTLKSSKLFDYIGKGDFLYYEVNASGKIARLSLLYDYDKKVSVLGTQCTNNTNNYTNSLPNNWLMFGEVSDVYINPNSNKTSALITLSKNGVDSAYLPVLPSTFKAVVYDSSSKRGDIYIGGLDDIVSLKNTAGEKANKLFVQMTSSKCTTVVIYK